MSCDRLSQEGEGVAMLLAAGFHDRQHRLDEPAAAGTLGPEGKFSPNHRMTQRSLARIVRRFDPFVAQERPQPRTVFVQFPTRAACIGVTAYALAVCVVLASGGYPGPHESGRAISGIESAEALGATVFHAGTRQDASGRIVTDGGRVLGVTALGENLAEAARRAYEAAGCLHFEGAHYRRDIAARALRRTQRGCKSGKE